MRIVHLLFAAALAIFGFTVAATAKVNVSINLTTQTMRVTSGSGESYVWPVSTARRGFVTPRGVYGAQRLARMHYSRKYGMAPMPHSIFFRGGYAIHGTNAVGALGRPASHGCIRLAPAHAAKLYAMVQREGVRIAIDGAPSHGRTMVASARAKAKKNAQIARARAQERALGYASAPRGRADRSVREWMRSPLPTR